MMRPLWKPKVGELWRATAPIPQPGLWIPEGTLILVIERVRRYAGPENKVIWAGGTGWIADLCQHWEPDDVPR